MDNKKTTTYYINKMLVDIKFVMDKTVGITYEELKANEVLLDCVLFRMIQVSESSAKISEEFKDLHTDIPWRAIKGMRNKIVHEYGDVDIRVVFDTITDDLPVLYNRLLTVAQ